MRVRLGAPRAGPRDRHRGGALDRRCRRPDRRRAMRVWATTTIRRPRRTDRHRSKLRLEPVPGWQPHPRRAVAGPREVPRRASSSTSARPARRSPRTSRPRPRSRPSIAARRTRLSLGGDIATAGHAPDGGWRVLVAEDSEVPADADGEAVAIAERARSRHPARRSAAGDAADRRRSITSSTRGRAAGRRRPGGPSRSSRPRASHANTAATAAIVRGERDPAGSRPRAPGAPDRDDGAVPARSAGCAGRLIGVPRCVTQRVAPGAPVAPGAEDHDDRSAALVRDPRRRRRLAAALQRRRLPRAARRSPAAQSAGWPRFLTVELHRNLALLSVVFLGAPHRHRDPRPVHRRSGRRRGRPARLVVPAGRVASRRRLRRSRARHHRHEPAARSDRPPDLARGPLAAYARVAARRCSTRSRPAAMRIAPWMLAVDAACVLAVGACARSGASTAGTDRAASRP